MRRTNFAKQFSNNVGGSNTANTNLEVRKYGRVLDVILDESHPEYQNRGGLRSINGVFYQLVGRLSKTTTDEDLTNFAYSNETSNIKHPIPGELVELKQQLAPSIDGSVTTKDTYYTKILNYWNNPNTSVFLDTKTFPDQDITLGGVFKEQQTINPLKPLAGDVLFQGRQGQSIRFTGVQNEDTTWEQVTPENDPLIIISNGQIQTEDGFSLISEDVNQDPSSIYLTSKQIIPLKPASSRYRSYDEDPKNISTYQHEQVIINSGRIVLNSKQSDILQSSNKSISLDAKTSVNIESEKYICLDSEKIFIGEKARTSPQSTREPVLLGNQTENFLQSMLNLIEGIAQDMALAQTVDGKPIPLLNKRGVQTQSITQVLRNRINPNGASSLKSKKVFTE